MTVLLVIIGAVLVLGGIVSVGLQDAPMGWSDFLTPEGAIIAIGVLGGLACIVLGATSGLA